MKLEAKFRIVFGALGLLLGIATPAASLPWFLKSSKPKEPFLVKFDDRGPYVILASKRSAAAYAKGIEKAVNLHSRAERADFDPEELEVVLDLLKRIQPRYALIFIQPDELDVNFAWRWLSMTSQVDDDPFVDVRTGFITGATPDAAETFMARIAAVADGTVTIPRALVDNLGPAGQSDPELFNMFAGALLLPSGLDKKFTLRSISHGKSAFNGSHLTSLNGAGLVHFGGHGHPDGIDDGLAAAQVAELKLAPCVVFNGACYTGVTHRWYDETTGKVTEKTVEPPESFCLQLLQKDVLGYLAALHPDHGMPVYQEMEYLACNGASLGDVIKHTYDGVVLGAGGKLPAFGQLSSGSDVPPPVASDIMLKGTAARILLGDPALIACDGCLLAPFSIDTTEVREDLRITATLTNPDLKSTFTDTYHNDLNPEAPFNDRALLKIDLPDGWESVGKVEVARVQARGTEIPYRLIGYAVEQDRDRARLHVQVDVPARGFQRSRLRTAGATVELILKR